MKPNMLCEVDGKMEPCSYSQACSGGNYAVDHKNSYHSLTSDYELVCEKEDIKRFCSSLVFSGGIVGSLITVFY